MWKCKKDNLNEYFGWRGEIYKLCWVLVEGWESHNSFLLSLRHLFSSSRITWSSPTSCVTRDKNVYQKNVCCDRLYLFERKLLGCIDEQINTFYQLEVDKVKLMVVEGLRSAMISLSPCMACRRGFYPETARRVHFHFWEQQFHTSLASFLINWEFWYFKKANMRKQVNNGQLTQQIRAVW